MKSFFPGLPALLLASGLAFGLSACGDGTDPDVECTETADCSGAEECVDGACVIVDLCAEVTCPGAQTCNDETGACEGECCGPTDCTGRTEECNEDKCLAGEANICDELTCPGDGPNQGCQEGFFCNMDSLECVAECVQNGCENIWEMCDATTGQCVDRPPQEGELGANCDPANDTCSSGMFCQPWIGGATCVKECDYDTNGDSDCPTGSYCEPNLFGPGSDACMDLCDPVFGDCADGVQCLELGRANACIPVLEVSECTTDCLPNGSACDPEVANQCEAGSACNGLLADPQCQQIQCEVAGNPCGAGASCEPVAFAGLSACFIDCDAQDPAACQDLGTTCQPNSDLQTPFTAFNYTTTDVPCEAGQDTLELGGDVGINFCYDGCTTTADCGAGQFCLEGYPLTQTDTVNLCVSYTAMYGTCAQGDCGTADCTDIEVQEQDGSWSDAYVCHTACTADSDCTEAWGGSCTAMFANERSDGAFLCTYRNTGSFCAGAGCESDVDCGYCASDADCGVVRDAEGRQRQQRCDVRSNTCVTPLGSAAEASTWCRFSQDFWAGAVLDADGATVSGGCGIRCTDDAHCAGTCGVDGFCIPEAASCNSATGQCESVGCTVDTAADDCLHGTCDEAAGPSGENVCALACGTDQSCEAGTCDTAANVCI